MIIGLTAEERHARQKRDCEWSPCHRIWPVKLIDGRWACFQELERINYHSNLIPYGTNKTNGFCYREKESK